MYNFLTDTIQRPLGEGRYGSGWKGEEGRKAEKRGRNNSLHLERVEPVPLLSLTTSRSSRSVAFSTSANVLFSLGIPGTLS